MTNRSPTPNLSAEQVTLVATTATLLVAEQKSRRHLFVKNQEASGGASVNVANLEAAAEDGYTLVPGEVLHLEDFTGELWAYSSGTPTLGIIEI